MRCPHCGKEVERAHAAPCTRDALLARGLLRRLAGRLDDQDREVMTLLAQGKTRQHVACVLGINAWTVDRIVRRVLELLGAENTTAAAAQLAAAGVIDPLADAEAGGERGGS